jgi:ADP-ribose pyrophosphatase YjhB (NUDIX family)
MGASKAAAEVFIRHMHHDERISTQFIITRFGNVLGSSGSVIPLFQRQIENRRPLTVTHKEVTRYFMTIPEACQLVLEAGVMGKGGEIFVFDMGEPIKIYELARRLIQLSGLVPEKDIPIRIVGLRPGEKLYEELLADKEAVKPTHHPKIMIARAVEEIGSNDLSCFNKLAELCRDRENLNEILSTLKLIVPTYKKSNQDKKSVKRLFHNRPPEAESNSQTHTKMNEDLEQLRGQKGLRRMFLRTVGKVLPTDIFAPRHILAVKAICVIKGRVLLLKTETGLWDLPGGKLRPGEQWEHCIVREVKEEINLEVESCRLLKLQSHLVRKMTQVTVALVHCQVNEDPGSISLSQEHFGVKLASLRDLSSTPLLLPYAETISETLEQYAMQ